MINDNNVGEKYQECCKCLGQPMMEKENKNNKKIRMKEKVLVYNKKMFMNQYKRNKSIDSLLPIGRGQRELIIGIVKQEKQQLQ